MSSAEHPADRRVLLVAIGLTIVLGGVSRLFPLGMPWWDKYVGDMAYAALATFAIAWCWNRAPVLVPPVVALVFCVAVESFQLTGIPLQLNRSEVVAVRILAALVLGSTFSWWDILAYGIGVVLAAVVDMRFARSLHTAPATTQA